MYIYNFVEKQSRMLFSLLPKDWAQLMLIERIELLGLEDQEDVPLSCPRLLRQFCISSEWKRGGYGCFKYIQKKRDVITAWPGVYHSGINTGWNFNEAVINFGTKSWLEQSRSYRPALASERIVQLLWILMRGSRGVRIAGE